MKATMNLPDELYRKVKAQSALRGQPVREVVIGLLEDWISSGAAELPGKDNPTEASTLPSWFGGAGKYAKRVHRHDLNSVRRSIARGRTREGESTPNLEGSA